MKSRMRNKNLTEEPIDTYDEYDLNVNFLSIQLQYNRTKMVAVLRNWLKTTDKDYHPRTALNEFANIVRRDHLNGINYTMDEIAIEQEKQEETEKW